MLLKPVSPKVPCESERVKPKYIGEERDFISTEVTQDKTTWHVPACLAFFAFSGMDTPSNLKLIGEITYLDFYFAIIASVFQESSNASKLRRQCRMFESIAAFVFAFGKLNEFALWKSISKENVSVLLITKFVHGKDLTDGYFM